MYISSSVASWIPCPWPAGHPCSDLQVGLWYRSNSLKQALPRTYLHTVVTSQFKNAGPAPGHYMYILQVLVRTYEFCMRIKTGRINTAIPGTTSELYFMCFCPLYVSLRIFLYCRIRCKYPLFDLLTPHNKLIFLLCNSDLYVNSCVGAFIYSGFAVKKLSVWGSVQSMYFRSCLLPSAHFSPVHLPIRPTCVFHPGLHVYYLSCIVMPYCSVQVYVWTHEP